MGWSINFSVLDALTKRISFGCEALKYDIMTDSTDKIPKSDKISMFGEVHCRSYPTCILRARITYRRASKARCREASFHHGKSRELSR